MGFGTLAVSKRQMGTPNSYNSVPSLCSPAVQNIYCLPFRNLFGREEPKATV